MTTTYKLIEPIKRGEEITSTLELNAPKVKDLKAMDATTGDIAKVAKLIELCANIPPSTVDQISSKDFKELGKILESFL